MRCELTFSSSRWSVKKKTSRCALKLSSLSFFPRPLSNMIPLGAGGSVVGGSGSRSVVAKRGEGPCRSPSCSCPWSARANGAFGSEWDEGTCGRLGGLRPSESSDASAADRPAAYELMIFLSA